MIVPGRDEDDAGLAHRVAALVVEVGAMLDGADPGPQRGLSCLGAP
jgi:hypothetical protein